MPWYAREQRPGPLGAGLVQIRVADAAVGDGDLDVIGAGCAAGDIDGFKGAIARVGAVGFDGEGHGWCILGWGVATILTRPDCAD